jgi:hypothetical protein
MLGELVQLKPGDAKAHNYLDRATARKLPPSFASLWESVRGWRRHMRIRIAQ